MRVAEEDAAADAEAEVVETEAEQMLAGAHE